jgi:tRNA 2-selenouridine synthase
VPQPSQKQFETRIATDFEAFDLARPVYVEGESARIGRLSVPIPLVARMRESDCIEVHADPAARLAYLLRDYAYLGDDREALADQLGKLKELQGKAVVDRWQQWARAGELAPLFAELMLLHYDPHYERSQEKHFSRWPQRTTVPAGDLTEAGIEAVAAGVLSLRTAPAT